MKRSNNTPAVSSKFFSYLICFLWLAVMGWNVRYFLNFQDIANIEDVSKFHLPHIKSIHFSLRDIADGSLESPYLRTRIEDAESEQSEAEPAIEAHDKDSKVTESGILSEEDKSPLPIHIVFSTDCSFFQDWQTIVVFYSAVQVRQQGEITRIASGCDDEKKKELTELYRKLYPQFHVHFTPDFKTDGHSKKKYDFYNKPFGMHHWLEHADPPIADGTIIMLIDPDFVFLRPLKVHFGADNNLIPMKVSTDNFVYPTRFGQGRAVAQLYGLGAPWTNAHSTEFNKSEICGEGSPCLGVTNQFGEQHYRYVIIIGYILSPISCFI